MTRWLALAAFALCSCDGRDVVVFTTPAGGVPANAGSADGADANRGSGGQPPNGGSAAAGGPSSNGGAIAGSGGTATDAGGGTPCQSSQDCSIAWACAKRTCRDMLGVCQPRPVLCDPAAAPVCGCDHVTYWNDCIRQQYGVAASSAGQCGSDAASCFSGGDCGVSGASCSHLLPAVFGCAPPGPGTCWVTPSDCSAASDSRGWVLCPPPSGSGPPPSGGGGPPPCKSTCDAIQSGGTYIALPPGTACAP
ncbi:MAG TPA: hypothetical protein VHC69_20765 [Polyangiaceae bacterium]|nr:hypothetical protein [Polyangiaceae bacterium]